MEYKVIKSTRKTLSLEIRDGELLVRAPLRATRRNIEDFIRRNEAWILRQLSRQAREKAELSTVEKLSEEELSELKRRAKTVFAERVAFYAPQLLVSPERITIRAQRSKWGSCSSKGNLNFNCLLLLAPAEVLDSVVVHELCHLKHMNHSREFYDEVLRIFPNYRNAEKWLKEQGSSLMARLPQT